MSLIIRGGSVLTPDETLEATSVVIEDGRIEAFVPDRSQAVDAPTLDATGLWVIPGLIDVHVHGSAGSDGMDATPDALHTMARYFLRHGVTSYLPTTITAPAEALRAAIDNVVRTPQPEDGAQHLGVHLEGPYLREGQHGAQPREYLRPPDPAEYEPWFDSILSSPGYSGQVRLVTVAPEVPGALEMIAYGAVRGVRFSAGHTAASYDQIVAAVECGLTQSTHTFNGMTGLHHREPGAVGAVLSDDRIYAEIIADGVHVHPAVVRVMVRAKGVERTLLVTDAMRAAGLEDGDYDLGGQTVHVREGVARTSTGGLAGSMLALNAAVRNVMRFAGLTPNQAVAMATRIPAQALGLAGRKGVLQPGADADLILVDSEMNVCAVVVGGRVVLDSRKRLTESNPYGRLI